MVFSYTLIKLKVKSCFLPENAAGGGDGPVSYALVKANVKRFFRRRTGEAVDCHYRIVSYQFILSIIIQ